MPATSTNYQISMICVASSHWQQICLALDCSQMSSRMCGMVLFYLKKFQLI